MTTGFEAEDHEDELDAAIGFRPVPAATIRTKLDGLDGPVTTQRIVDHPADNRASPDELATVSGTRRTNSFTPSSEPTGAVLSADSSRPDGIDSASTARHPDGASSSSTVSTGPWQKAAAGNCKGRSD